MQQLIDKHPENEDYFRNLYDSFMKALKEAIEANDETEPFIIQNANKPEAIKYFKMAADAGYDDAMNHYANKLFYGDRIEIKKQEAVKYYKFAISKGNAFALNNYADLLFEGSYIPINKQEVIKYYK